MFDLTLPLDILKVETGGEGFATIVLKLHVYEEAISGFLNEGPNWLT